MTIDTVLLDGTVYYMGTFTETIHGDPIIYTGWDTDTITIHCGCGASIDVPAGSGLWQILRAYIDHETAEQ